MKDNIKAKLKPNFVEIGYRQIEFGDLYVELNQNE